MKNWKNFEDMLENLLTISKSDTRYFILTTFPTLNIFFNSEFVIL